MDESVEKRSYPQKIMAIRDDYVSNNMFDLDETIVAAVKKKKAFRTAKTFSRTMNLNTAEPVNACQNNKLF